MLVHGTLTFTLIISAGFLPALLWLWLILKEDREHPEPRMRLILSFLGGMMAVVAVIPIQKIFVELRISPVFLVVVLALIEEVAKFGFSYFLALRTKDTDEPIDEVIYMITTALGFAAFENSLFLAIPLMEGRFVTGLIIAHARFLGSTLVHVVCSGIVGICMARTFHVKDGHFGLMLGLIIATGLHTLYNLLIIRSEKGSLMLAFGGLWLVSIMLIYITNHVKHTFYKKVTI